VFHIEMLYFFECCLFERCCFFPFCLEELREFLAFCFLVPEGDAFAGGSAEVAWRFRPRDGKGLQGERPFFFVDGASCLS